MTTAGYAIPADDELVLRAQSGDAAAFGVLAERHSPRLRRVLYRITRDCDAAYDEVQEALARAWSVAEHRPLARLPADCRRAVTSRDVDGSPQPRRRQRSASANERSRAGCTAAESRCERPSTTISPRGTSLEPHSYEARPPMGPPAKTDYLNGELTPRQPGMDERLGARPTSSGPSRDNRRR
jgi:hypothetical protein